MALVSAESWAPPGDRLALALAFLVFSARLCFYSWAFVCHSVSPSPSRSTWEAPGGSVRAMLLPIPGPSAGHAWDAAAPCGTRGASRRGAQATQSGRRVAGPTAEPRRRLPGDRGHVSAPPPPWWTNHYHTLHAGPGSHARKSLIRNKVESGTRHLGKHTHICESPRARAPERLAWFHLLPPMQTKQVK